MPLVAASGRRGWRDGAGGGGWGGEWGGGCVCVCVWEGCVREGCVGGGGGEGEKEKSPVAVREIVARCWSHVRTPRN